MGRNKRILLLLIVSGLILFVIAGTWQSIQPKAECNSSETSAPDFSLIDQDGNVFQLKDFRGSIVVLDFMATWCGPCRASMPGLKALWNKYNGRVVMVSIGVDPLYDTEERLRDWINGWGATWTHARDVADPPVSLLYGITGIPTYVIINKEGCIRHRHVGLTPEGILSKEIEALLKE